MTESSVPPAESSDDHVAAVDLGSNSFHLIVARIVDGHPRIVDRLRERTALAEGLRKRNRLASSVHDRALAAIEMFGQRVREFPSGSVRAVGTNTFRQLEESAFLAEAEAVLGHPIEVISGQEEARLIYLGVADTVEADPGRRLVVDIGGGSTECIIGEHLDPILTESLYMGCVSYSLRFFPEGGLSTGRMRRARIAAGQELESIRQPFRQLGWSRCSGSSGTIRAVERIVIENGWSRAGITPKALKKLRKTIQAAGHIDDLSLAGLEKDRVGVIAGGVAILQAIFDRLKVEEMRAARGALREGILHDLLGRLHRDDVRHRTIRDFMTRYHVDLEQAARVEQTALTLLDPVAGAWGVDREVSRDFLVWAAHLHEVGLAVSHSGYHRHGGYLLAHADMPGFSRQDQNLLSVLVEKHRRKFSLERFDSLSKKRAAFATQLTVLLRLAVLLNRGRSDDAPPSPSIQVDEEGGLALSFRAGWLQEHPLTVADLEEEAERLAGVGVLLTVEGVSGDGED